MKTFALCSLTFLLTVGFLQSGMTPWCVIARAELEDLHHQVQLARDQAQSLAQKPKIGGGAWMRDPARRTGLDSSNGTLDDRARR